MSKWFEFSSPGIVGMFVSAVVVYAAIIVYCRIFGLRSFSKMSAADFAMTVAVGSLFASIIATPDPALGLGLAALCALFLGQWVVAHLRKRIPGATKLLDNNPVLLMKNGEIIEENLKSTGVTKSDLMSKLREANAFRFEEVAAVVFETTGDVTVLHSAELKYGDIDDPILEGVKTV
ncbi:MAG: hypothetical protein CMO55_14395 [Verrucomicrobiales bacterium]|nr:hypothetical protein [Verrucomicrobiales bacterium]